MTPVDALAWIKLAQYAIRQYEMWSAGELSDEQLQDRWEAMKVRRNIGKDMWEDAAT